MCGQLTIDVAILILKDKKCRQMHTVSDAKYVLIIGAENDKNFELLKLF